ncbi:MAG TPA: amino acid deaminase, partial [Marisediminicola sp.]|nr:amino acid deaminase [Marisediminicola sp.]
MTAETTLDWRFKGFPTTARGLGPDDFAASRPALFDSGFSWPMMVIKQSAVEHNVGTLANYCLERGVSL